MTELRRIRVLVDARLPNSEFGGVRTYVELILETLKGSPELEIFALGIPEGDWLEEYLPSSRILIRRKDPKSIQKRLPRIPALSYFARTVFYILKSKPTKLSQEELDWLKMKGIDVFHSAIQDCPEIEFPTIYHPHDFQHLVLPQHFDPATRIHRNRVWRRLANHASVVIVGSPSIRAELDSFWPEVSSKSRLIPAPVTSLRIRSTGGEKKSGILYTASFYRHKNHETLIKAYSKLPAQIRAEHTLNFVGAGPTEKDMKRQASRALGPTEVLFHGRLSLQEYRNLLAKSRLVCVPSEYEAGSFPILEAQGAGVRVICSNIPAFAELLSESVIPFGQPRDEEALALALETELSLQRDFKVNTETTTSSVNQKSFLELLVKAYRDALSS